MNEPDVRAAFAEVREAVVLPVKLTPEAVLGAAKRTRRRRRLAAAAGGVLGVVLVAIAALNVPDRQQASPPADAPSVAPSVRVTPTPAQVGVTPSARPSRPTGATPTVAPKSTVSPTVNVFVSPPAGGSPSPRGYQSPSPGGSVWPSQQTRSPGQPSPS